MFSDLLLSVDYYNFKPSLQEDILGAALVISHAGAGTCLETLDAKDSQAIAIVIATRAARLR